MSLYLNRLKLYFLLLFLITASFVHAQTMEYDIYRDDDRIGEITVKKNTNGDRVSYSANSQSNFRVVLFSNELETNLSADYENNELVSCSSKNILNGKIRNHASMKKQGGQYSIFKHPDEKYLKKDSPIRNSTVLLYYSEPVNIKQVYSENYLELCPIKPLGNHSYELVLPGGKINHYIYENGKLVEIKVFRSFVDLSFRLRQQG